jgi:hypothetical protein
MGKKDKLTAKLLNRRATFTWHDLVSLLNMLGYQQLEGSGSRVKFIHADPPVLISLHKPHPSNNLKQYAKRQLIEALQAGGHI